MKKLIALIFILSFSTFSVASMTETSSFRTSSNQTVALGDSLNQLIDRTGQSPNSIKTTTWQEGTSTINAIEYHYNIGENLYVLTMMSPS